MQVRVSTVPRIGGRARAVILAATAAFAGTSSAQAILSGDARTACEAILCLAASQRPHECTPSITRLMSLKPWKRPGFLRKCPQSGAVDVDRLLDVDALGNGVISIPTSAGRFGGGRQVMEVRAVSCHEAAAPGSLRSRAMPNQPALSPTADGLAIMPGWVVMAPGSTEVLAVAHSGYANRAVWMELEGARFQVGYGAGYVGRLLELDAGGNVTSTSDWVWGTSTDELGRPSSWAEQCSVGVDDLFRPRPTEGNGG